MNTESRKKIPFIVNDKLNERDYSNYRGVSYFKNYLQPKFGKENIPLYFYRFYDDLIEDTDENIKYLTTRQSTDFNNVLEYVSKTRRKRQQGGAEEMSSSLTSKSNSYIISPLMFFQKFKDKYENKNLFLEKENLLPNKKKVLLISGHNKQFTYLFREYIKEKINHQPDQENEIIDTLKYNEYKPNDFNNEPTFIEFRKNFNDIFESWGNNYMEWIKNNNNNNDNNKVLFLLKKIHKDLKIDKEFKEENKEKLMEFLNILLYRLFTKNKQDTKSESQSETSESPSETSESQSETSESQSETSEPTPAPTGTPTPRPTEPPTSQPSSTPSSMQMPPPGTRISEIGKTQNNSNPQVSERPISNAVEAARSSRSPHDPSVIKTERGNITHIGGGMFGRRNPQTQVARAQQAEESSPAQQQEPRKMKMANLSLLEVYKEIDHSDVGIKINIKVKCLFKGFVDKSDANYIGYDSHFEVTKEGHEYFRSLLKNDESIIYIRHGQGYHNKPLKKKIIDSSLTRLGIFESVLVGYYLKDYLNFNEKYDIVGIISSELIRTHITVLSIIEILKNEESPLQIKNREREKKIFFNVLFKDYNNKTKDKDSSTDEHGAIRGKHELGPDSALTIIRERNLDLIHRYNRRLYDVTPNLNVNSYISFDKNNYDTYSKGKPPYSLPPTEPSPKTIKKIYAHADKLKKLKQNILTQRRKKDNKTKATRKKQK